MRMGGGGSERSFGIRLAHSGGAVPQRIGAGLGGLDPPCGATDERPRGGADRPSRHPPQRERAPRSRGPGRSAIGGRSSGNRTALPLAARHVRVDRFVLPAVLPLAVDGEFGLAPRFQAHAACRVGLVGSRQVTDGCPPEPLVRHVAHILSAGRMRAPGPQYPLRTGSGTGSFPPWPDISTSRVRSVTHANDGV
jgi:hypothetical protein